MFSTLTYTNRRKKLSEGMGHGLILLPGNFESAYNYSSNTYRFRQDSVFSYFFGIHEPNLTGLIDRDEGHEYIFGDAIDMEDVIWMGPLPSLEERAATCGIHRVLPSQELLPIIRKAQKSGRPIHYLSPYRCETILFLTELLGVDKKALYGNVSEVLAKRIIELRSVKDKDEIAEIERMVGVAYDMHTTAMRMARVGSGELEIAGVIEGIALSHGNGVSFPVILSMNGETLHNHRHNQILEKNRLLLTDAGSESELLYASDITRTVPVGGTFNDRQKDIYSIVLEANLKTIEMTGPTIPYHEVHRAAAEVIASGLKGLGLMRGSVEDAVRQGAHALFFPHGLGHMLGLDVHDMEGLGEDLVGYDDTIRRSDQFGMAYLRFARKPKPGYVLTDEPGIYFIPSLIDLWKKDRKFEMFINYDAVEQFRDFGGIRIEDDILVTETGCRVLGKPIPKTIDEIESIMA